MAARGSSRSNNKQGTMDYQQREEHYKRMNEELEAKTANLVKEAEEVLKAQDSLLSSKSNLLDKIDTDDFLRGFDDETPLPDSISRDLTPSSNRIILPKQNNTVPRPVSGRRQSAKSKSSPRNKITTMNKTAENITNQAFMTESQDMLSDAVSKLEGQINSIPDVGDGDNILPSDIGNEAQMRFLKAKVRVMQEELDKLTDICKNKDEENLKLQGKIKEIDEEKNRIQRTASSQHSQIEKYKRLADEHAGKSETSDTQLSALRKELETLRRAQKQQTTTQSATEVRLNRALEEVAKYKDQLQKMKSSGKESEDQDKKKIETLLADNRKLEKQKNELMVGFKKQLKLIDVLKRQKMHIEAAKMLAFTEEEFVKALDWGN